MIAEELIRTGEVARLLGCSRQHVVDLCNEGKLAFRSTGVHRRIRREDVEAYRDAQAPRREVLRSLWLSRVIAAKIARDPERVLEHARRNLERFERVHTGTSTMRWLDEWRQVLDSGADEVMRVLTSETPHARDMRQNSPFAGVLSDAERSSVLASFRRWWDQRAA